MNGGATAIGTSGLAPLTRAPAATRTSDRVFDQLVAAIRDLRLAPGSTLSETELAEQFQVSRTPVREALARLADAGLIQIVPQVGTRVSLIRLFEMEQTRFVRESLEVAAFEAACGKPVRDVTGLRALIHTQRAACDLFDLDGFFRADEELHEQIFVLSGYPGAWLAVQRMKLQLDRLRRLSLPDRALLTDLIAEHTLIVDALEQGAVIAGCEHIRHHARRVLVSAPELRRKHPDFFTPYSETAGG